MKEPTGAVSGWQERPSGTSLGLRERGGEEVLATIGGHFHLPWEAQHSLAKDEYESQVGPLTVSEVGLGLRL